MPLQKQKKISALIIGILLCINSATANNIKITKDIEFAVVNNQGLKLDLYQPKKPKSSPLVVWIHGVASDIICKNKANPFSLINCIKFVNKFSK